ncbi:MAG TPA: ROK family transcriptional regulator [Rugosimonospora sp.]|nr:ROK family transcriptional regulator [Rugosimonospora sp.]
MSPRTPAGTNRDAPVRQSSLRAHNLALVLRQVSAIAATGRPVSRADVAAATGLTRATVSTLVDELVRGQLVAEIGPAPRTGAGRPATGLVLAGTGPAGLGLEINVDYLAACVLDLAGTVRHRATEWTDQRNREPAEVVASLAQLARSATGAAADQGLEAVGVAVAVPGLVQDGVVRLAPNLGWRGVPLAALLAPALGGPRPTVDNEANLAALGEAAPGESFVYVSGEVGIGAGIVLGGELFRGTHGWAGELGHVAIHPDGPLCHCGSRGCLEQYAGQEAILATAGASLPRGVQGTVTDAVARASAGEPGMLAALDAAGTALGVAVAGVVNLLDVGTVVLGGSYALLAPWLAGPVERELTARVLTAGWSPVTVRASRLGTEATVVGAAGSVVRALREDPATWLAGRTS